MEYIDERPDEAELRRELGDDQAAWEAGLVLPRLATREALAVTLKRSSGGG
ncbi:hypothetical protein ACWCQW_25615 [Streptomyces mirabilis]